MLTGTRAVRRRRRVATRWRRCCSAIRTGRLAGGRAASHPRAAAPLPARRIRGSDCRRHRRRAPRDRGARLRRPSTLATARLRSGARGARWIRAVARGASPRAGLVGRAAAAPRRAPAPCHSLRIAVPPTDSPLAHALTGRAPARLRRDDEGASRCGCVARRRGRPRAGGHRGRELPFWAPDGRSIGFFAEGKLKRIDLAGGASEALADAPNGRGGTWNSDGVILFTPGNATRPADHASIRRGRHTVRGNASRTWRRQPPVSAVSPRWTPVHVLQHGSAAPIPRAFTFASLDGGEPIRWLATETPGVFVPPDRLLLVQGDALMAARFDAAGEQSPAS